MSNFEHQTVYLKQQRASVRLVIRGTKRHAEVAEQKMSVRPDVHPVRLAQPAGGNTLWNDRRRKGFPRGSYGSVDNLRAERW